MDLRAVWGSGHRLVEEYEGACGRLPADEAINIATIFNLAAKQAKDHQLGVVRAVMMDRQSSQPDRPSLTLQANPSSSSLQALQDLPLCWQPAGVKTLSAVRRR